MIVRRNARWACTDADHDSRGSALFRCAKDAIWLRANIGVSPRLTLVPISMIDTKPLDDLANRISALIAATPARDVEKNLRALLSGALGRLDLVTREEFDLQREALARARERLAALEARIIELEQGRK